jgi:transcriptional regulator with XRE-family HTH domain
MKNVFNDLSMRVELKATDLGARVRQLREERSLRRYALAQAVGISKAAIADLETGAVHRANPSLAALRRIAAFLKTNASYLIDGVAMRPEDADPVLARSQESLHRFADASGISHKETQLLWNDFVLEYQTQRRAVAEARTEPLSKEEWKLRRDGKVGKRQMSLALDDEE